MFCFGCQLSVRSYCTVKTHDQPKFRLNTSTTISRTLRKPDKKSPPDVSNLTRDNCASVVMKCPCLYTILILSLHMYMDISRSGVLMYKYYAIDR